MLLSSCEPTGRGTDQRWLPAPSKAMIAARRGGSAEVSQEPPSFTPAMPAPSPTRRGCPPGPALTCRWTSVRGPAWAPPGGAAALPAHPPSAMTAARTMSGALALRRSGRDLSTVASSIARRQPCRRPGARLGSRAPGSAAATRGGVGRAPAAGGGERRAAALRRDGATRARLAKAERPGGLEPRRGRRGAAHLGRQEPRRPHLRKQVGPRSTPQWSGPLCALLGGGAHVGGLRALRPVDHVELDGLAFVQRAVAAGLDRAEMHEHVRTGLRADEAEPLVSVEPLDGPNGHECLSLPPSLGGSFNIHGQVPASARDKLDWDLRSQT